MSVSTVVMFSWELDFQTCRGLECKTSWFDAEESRIKRSTETLADTIEIKRPSSYSKGIMRIIRARKTYIAKNVHPREKAHAIDRIRLISSLLRIGETGIVRHHSGRRVLA